MAIPFNTRCQWWTWHALVGFTMALLYSYICQTSTRDLPLTRPPFIQHVRPSDALALSFTFDVFMFDDLTL